MKKIYLMNLILFSILIILIAGNAEFQIKKGNDVYFKIDETGNVEIKKGFTVDGGATIKNDLTVVRDANFKKTLTVDDKAHLKNDLTVDGDANFKKNLTVNENANINKDLMVNGDLTVKGDVHFENNKMPILKAGTCTDLNPNGFTSGVKFTCPSNCTLLVGFYGYRCSVWNSWSLESVNIYDIQGITYDPSENSYKYNTLCDETCLANHPPICLCWKE